jgi:hypothetical protein
MKKLLLIIFSAIIWQTSIAQNAKGYKKNLIVSVSTTPLSVANPDRYLPIQFKISNIEKKYYLQANVGYVWRTLSFLRVTQGPNNFGANNIKQNGIYTELEGGKYLRGTKTALGIITQFKTVNCTFDAQTAEWPVIAGKNRFKYDRFLLAPTYSFLMPGKMTLLNYGFQVAAGATYKQYVSNGVKDIDNGGLNNNYVTLISPSGFFPYLHLRCTIGFRF